MRFWVAAAMMLLVISFTSCNETQPTPSERTAELLAEPSQGNEHAHASSPPANDTHVEFSRGESHESAHEHRGNHAQPALADASHHGEGHSAGSGHTDEHNAHGSRKTGSHSTHHQHGGSNHESHDDGRKIAIGDKVPDFDVTIDGKKWMLSELRQSRELTADGTLVLTFWCSFCHSCRHVEHSLDALAKEYRGQVGVLAIDASAGETVEDVAEFAKQRELTLPIALDATGAVADIFGTRVTTTTVVIDKDGLLRYRGQFSDAQEAFAEDALRAVLAGDDVPVQETRQKG